MNEWMGDVFPFDGFMLINTRLIKLFMGLNSYKISEHLLSGRIKEYVKNNKGFTVQVIFWENFY